MINLSENKRPLVLASCAFAPVEFCLNRTTREKQAHKVKLKLKSKLQREEDFLNYSKPVSIVVKSLCAIVILSLFHLSRLQVCDASKQSFASSEHLSSTASETELDTDDASAVVMPIKRHPFELTRPRLLRRKWRVVASRWQNEVLLPCQIVDLDDEQTVSMIGIWPSHVRVYSTVCFRDDAVRSIKALVS